MFRVRQKCIPLLFVMGFFLGNTSVVYASVDCDKKDQQDAGELSEDIYGKVQDATELLSESKYPEAIEQLVKLSEKISSKGTAYEKALVNYNLGLAYSSTDDYANAAKAFAKALETDSLPRGHRDQLRYNLGQLYIVTNQYEEGIKTLENYMKTSCSEITADAHIFLANALTEKKRYVEALPQINLALSKAKDVKESWLQLKLAVHYELKDYKSCGETLVHLIAKTPNKAEYWKQLSSVLYEMKQDVGSLAVLALAEQQGFLEKPTEIKNLYNIYMMLESPYKAGNLLETAMANNVVPSDEDHLSSLSDAWINAREAEKAEATLKKLAAMSNKGDYYFKLGAMYGDNERWNDSKDMLKKALDKGGLKHVGDVWMRLAVANYGLNDNPATIAALKKATTFDESRDQAGQWLRALSASAMVEN